MRKLINNWQNISAVLAVVTIFIAVSGQWDLTQRTLLLLNAFLLLHFFEEFGWPGGFPYMGMKVMMGNTEPDPGKWNVNNLSSMFGNWGFLLLVYIPSLFLTELKPLTIAVVLFSILEGAGHLLIFNIRMRSFYNPGMITAVFGMVPVAVYYLNSISGRHLYVWHDCLIGLAWCAAVFLFCFRSPLYWKLGAVKGYPLTHRSAFGMYKAGID